MAEEFARRGVDPVSPASEIFAVEIELEDLVLAELSLERERQDCLLDLARIVPLVGEEDIAGELLRDGRCRANPMAFDQR